MTIKSTLACLVLATLIAAPSAAQPLTDAERLAIDAAAKAALEATASPGTSVAVVRGGQIVYEQAHGIGGIDPQTPARPEMRYAIGSVSKQFTATAVLMLQEDGKLSLDDRVAKWFPRLTSASEIYEGLTKGTIDRSLLTPSANAFFTAAVLADCAASLAPLGAPTEFNAGGDGLRGGMVIRSFRIRAGGVVLDITMMSLPDGKIDQFIVSRAG
jgi:CubicO group peptidase (beta-lactamase class C family)